MKPDLYALANFFTAVVPLFERYPTGSALGIAAVVCLAIVLKDRKQ